ncbi:MAG: hypothetical protein IJ404_05680 [Clostridia bacterium]|nr:hypothetical protein [Clostridia bacterium]
MYIEEIQETEVWQLYEKGRNYHRLTGIYTDTDRNYRMYNGNQWEHANLGGIEPTQQNFIKPIVKYKISVIHDNLYAINYSSLNFENQEFRAQAERYCKLLNSYASRIWEQDKMDFKGRRLTKDAAINDEGILYVDFDREKMKPINEIVKKSEIYYGNENDDDIQNQPYILIRKRMAVSNAVELALSKGMSEDKIELIVGDNDNYEESGEAAKDELDNMVTVIYKLYKKDGTVYFSAATRYAKIAEDVDLGISLYPVAHFVWEEKEGSARGEGEVRCLIPNQIEVNRTLMRRVLTAKKQAYPYKVVDILKIKNPDALDTVGGTLQVNNQMVDDVRKIVTTIPPAQMSPDVVQLQQELINVTRELAGAGDTATGQVDPEAASGRAILAVQQASQAPMTEQKESYKNFLEDVAKIWIEYLTAYSENGVNLEEEFTDPKSGKEAVRIVNVPKVAMENLQATVKIDVTPKSVYDRFAQERTIENLLLNGLLSSQRLPELKAYVEALDDDSVAPKMKLKKIIEYAENEQRKIAMIDAQAQMVQQRARQFLMGDPEEQSSMMADAQMQLMAQRAGA